MEPILKGDFIVEYRGVLLSQREGEEKEKEYDGKLPQFI